MYILPTPYPFKTKNYCLFIFLSVQQSTESSRLIFTEFIMNHKEKAQVRDLIALIIVNIFLAIAAPQLWLSDGYTPSFGTCIEDLEACMNND